MKKENTVKVKDKFYNLEDALLYMTSLQNLIERLQEIFREKKSNGYENLEIVWDRHMDPPVPYLQGEREETAKEKEKRVKKEERLKSQKIKDAEKKRNREIDHARKILKKYNRTNK